MKNRIRLTESELHRIIKESVRNVLNELDRSTMQSAYDKMRQQGRYAQARSMNNTFNDMYNGYDQNGNYVNQTDLAGSPRHYFLNRSSQGESTISNGKSTYGDETGNYNPNVTNSYLGDKNDDLAQKAQQIQNWQHGRNNAVPYRTNSNMTPDYARNADNERRREEMMQRRGQRQ